MEVESGTYAKQRCCVDLAVMPDHPFFLLRHAESHPHEIRARFVDRRDVFGVLDGGQRPERRRAGASNDQAGMTPSQLVGEQLQNLRTGTVKIMPVATLQTVVTDSVKKV